jgi:hypothetical protein
MQDSMSRWSEGSLEVTKVTPSRATVAPIRNREDQ